jgi:hypothetical protein
LPTAVVAACREAVLVMDPAKIPRAKSIVKPMERAQPIAANTPAMTAISARILALTPAGLARPRKKSTPYWMPMP